MKNKKCYICGKPAYTARSRYCLTCARFAFRMKARQFPPWVVKKIWEYVSKYGGNASGVSADIAEAYSVGEVMDQAVTATGGTDNTKIIAYLHAGHILSSVQGPVKFDALGENSAAAAFVSQWQSGGNAFNQVLPVGEAGSVAIITPKPPWTS